MVSDIITTPRELHGLPDGTVIESADDCGWPKRYAGMRWRKHGDSLTPLTPDPYTRKTYSAHIAFFKDPLPAKVTSDVRHGED